MEPCADCEVVALERVLAVRDYLDCVIWGQVRPLHGIDVALKGLDLARAEFVAAGHREEDE
jgi:hypothetical protein